MYITIHAHKLYTIYIKHCRTENFLSTYLDFLYIHTPIIVGLKGSCHTYLDLSSEGSIETACSNVFSALRFVESAEILSKGAKIALLPDLSALSLQDEMCLALWERLVRAASGLSLDLDEKQA